MEDRLYKFAKLIDIGNYTRAAQELHVSQPALTTAIQKLEKELHATLIIRGGRQLRLTPAGRVAYEAAEQMSAQSRNLRIRTAEIGNAPLELKIGMIDSIAELTFIEKNAFSELGQETRLSLVIDNTARLVNYVAKGDLDLAIVTRPAILPASLQSEEVGKEPMVLVTNTTNKRHLEEELAEKQIPSFLGYNRNSNTYRFLNTYLMSEHIDVSYEFYSTSPHIMLEFLLHGEGSSILPYALAKDYINKDALAMVPIGDHRFVGRDIMLVYRPDYYLPQRAREVVEMASKTLLALEADLKTGK